MATPTPVDNNQAPALGSNASDNNVDKNQKYGGLLPIDVDPPVYNPSLNWTLGKAKSDKVSLAIELAIVVLITALFFGLAFMASTGTLDMKKSFTK